MPKSFIHQFLAELQPTDLSLLKGDHLFKQGSAVSNIYYIKSGRVKMIRNTIDGFSVLLHTGKTGETIAEASLFSSHYHCSAIADLNTEISLVKKQDLLQFLQHKPAEMMKLLAIFSQQIRELRSLNKIKNIRSAKERILSYIIINMNDDKEMMLDISLKDTAQKIGLAHETFYRELKKLQEEGQIVRQEKSIKII
jgi:CRP-like cAMP-binding protein